MSAVGQLGRMRRMGPATNATAAVEVAFVADVPLARRGAAYG